jgi:hypothetical protein
MGCTSDKFAGYKGVLDLRGPHPHHLEGQAAKLIPDFTLK